MKLIILETAAWTLVVVSCVVLATACPPSTPVLPSPDADALAPPPPSDCAGACAGLQRAGCVTLSDCPRVMCQANADPHFTHYNLACLANVKTMADVHACGADCTPAGDAP